MRDRIKICKEKPLETSKIRHEDLEALARVYLNLAKDPGFQKRLSDMKIEIDQKLRGELDQCGT